jgi:hypothetical protein
MIEYLHLPNNGDGKTGIDDYLAAGHTVDELMKLVRPDPPQLEEPAPLPPDAPLAWDIGKGSQEPVNGSELLESIRDWLATYISTVNDTDLDLLTLWAAHTHLVFETYTTPRLQIDSPVPESGKTTCLEHLERLCLRSIQMASLSSPALLTRMLNAEQRTILIDEADRSLNPDKEGIADLFAVLNSGYKRGGTRPVLVPGQGGQWAVAEMPTFAAVAIAGNNPNLPDDTRTRIIRVLLLPDLHGTVEESNWEEIEADALELHDQLVLWADQVRDQVHTERPGLPEGIIGRFREKWSPLKRVAAAAGGRWTAAVDVMALQDKEEYAMDKEDGLVQDKPAVVLLKHIHELWPTGERFVATEKLIDWLVIEYPNVWGADGPIGKRLTAKRLGGMLAKAYKIHSVQQGHGTPRGYLHAAFAKAWRQMGISPPQQSDECDATGESDDESSSDSSDAQDSSDTSGGVAEPVSTNGHKPASSDYCSLCGAGLWFPTSQQRGICTACWRSQPSGGGEAETA